MTGQHPGGIVQGPGGGDSIPVLLMPGEHFYDRHGRRVYPMVERTIGRDAADAATLRNAARVLQSRARKRTFALLVIVRVLLRCADKIEDRSRRG